MVTHQLAGRTAVIFGGSGFIGSRLASYLHSCGSDVIIADLRHPKTDLANTRYFQVDVREPVTLDIKLNQPLVFNLAAIHRTPGHDDHEYYDTNVAGALNIVGWCEQSDIRQLIFTSSIAVYGPSERILPESAPLEPISSYGRSKLLAERIQQHWLEADSRRRLVIVRPAVIFGPGEHGNFSRLGAALQAGRFVLPGRTDTVKACGYVEDLIEAIIFSLDQTEDLSVFNFCYPDRYNIGEIVSTMCRVLGCRPAPVAPASVGRLLLRLRQLADGPAAIASLAARATKLLESTAIEPNYLKTRGFAWPTDLEQGIKAWLASSPEPGRLA